MIKNALKNTGFALLTVASLALGSASITTSAQAAPLHINPISSIETSNDVQTVGYRGGHRFRGHRGGFRGGYSSHRGGYKKHHRSGHRSSFKAHKFSRHGGIRSHRFSRHGSYGHHRSRHGGFHRF